MSQITNMWINLMYHKLKSIETFPSWHIVKKYMPDAFKKEYPNTRIIIDATEFTIEWPSSLVSQASTFSSYKNRNTIKVLIGVTLSGLYLKLMKVLRILDRQLFEVCGLLEKLEPGDEVMADKGFISLLQQLQCAQHKVISEGNCLYYAVAHQAGFIARTCHGDASISQQLRMLALLCMNKYPDVRLEDGISLSVGAQKTVHHTA